MLERPALADEIILAGLYRDYGVDVVELRFLPIGYDARSWAFAVVDGQGHRYFLKVRRQPIYVASLAVPRYLADRGIDPVVAPLRTVSDALWSDVGDFALILYPYIDGIIAAQVERTDSQHLEFGALLAGIHRADLPASLLAQVKRETFRPQWAAMVRRLQTMMDANEFEDEIACGLAEEWQAHRAEISRIVERTEQLGRMLRARSTEFVLCHADIHAHNQLVDEHGGLHIVDWDGIILAPKERDLMFTVGDVNARGTRSRAEWHFFQGYGENHVDPVALAYYRYEWVVQEIGDCGERVLVTGGTGETTKRAAVQDFIELFEPGDVVEGAYAADTAIGAW